MEGSFTINGSGGSRRITGELISETAQWDIGGNSAYRERKAPLTLLEKIAYGLLSPPCCLRWSEEFDKGGYGLNKKRGRPREDQGEEQAGLESI